MSIFIDYCMHGNWKTVDKLLHKFSSNPDGSIFDLHDIQKGFLSAIIKDRTHTIDIILDHYPIDTLITFGLFKLLFYDGNYDLFNYINNKQRIVFTHRLDYIFIILYSDKKYDTLDFLMENSNLVELVTDEQPIGGKDSNRAQKYCELYLRKKKIEKLLK